jgi:hypothetical protein
VAPHEAPLARRDRAVELLTEILQHWVTEPIDSLTKIVVGPHDTPIERRFRALVMRWARSRGATVHSHATPLGDRVELVLPGAQGGARWKLTPKVNHSFVTPDFDLTTDDSDVPTIAVFCDGVRYHVDVEHNRVADDAVKRHELREQGILVWAVTHQDLDAFEAVLNGTPPVQPAWATTQVAEIAVGYGVDLCRAGDTPAASVLADPISVLMSFLLRPDPARWEPAARCAALALASTLAARVVAGSKNALPALVRAQLVGAAVVAPSGAADLRLGHTARGANLGVGILTQADVRAVLAVDDRDGVVGQEDQVSAWRDWLALGNVLGFLEPGSLYVASLAGLPIDPGAAVPAQISPAWREVAASFEESVAALLNSLATSGVAIPEAGLEVAGGEHSIDLAWPDDRLAVVIGDDPERDAWLVGAGWTVIPAQERRVRAALGLPEVES